MGSINIWFPSYYTEAHRTPERQKELVTALANHGICCHPNYDPCCIATFCGTIWQSDWVTETYYKHNLSIPRFEYCWDLYPWQIKGEAEECWKNHIWTPYIPMLRKCTGIIVPSKPVAIRIEQYTGRTDCELIKSPVKIWDAPTLSPGECNGEPYVVDVMRKYPDPNRHWVRECCDELGIKCVETGANLPWEEFKKVVYGATILVSAYFEASTGGLTLLEGYAHGRPCLVSDSPMMGALSYLRNRCWQFFHDRKDDLKRKIDRMMKDPQLQTLNVENCRNWVLDNYSDDRFAKEISAYIRSFL